MVQVFAWPTFGLMLLGMAIGFVVFYLRTARERRPITIALSLAGFAFVYGLFEKAPSSSLPVSCSSGWGTVAELRA